MSTVLESHESSSPIITRAVAKGLLGHSCENYHFSELEKAGLRLIGCLPKIIAEWIVPRVNSASAFAKEDVQELKTKDLIENRLSDYSHNTGKYPAITVGVGMGGTTAHLALALGGPFLPQAFVVTLKNGTINGDVKEYFELTDQTAKIITKNNPDLMSIQHYDPIHDGWLVKRVNHLRVKLIDLPQQYKEFIHAKLEPGGAVVYLEGNATWKRFRTGERNVFQVGGWGDISADEFIDGSDRLSRFAKNEKLEHDRWQLPGYPVEEGPESEWGSEAGLGEALRDYCQKKGYQFIKIAYKDPNHFSKLSYLAKRKILAKENIEPAGVVVEMFSQFDTSIVDQTALIPLWLIFNTKDSLDFLKSMTPEFPKGKPVFFSGLSTFSNTPDLVTWKEWMDALKEFEVINIGARPSHYPADTTALLNWKKPLLKWAKTNHKITSGYLSGEELQQISRNVK